ncbi:unnamed protein product, partial [Polarella glacialis]
DKVFLPADFIVRRGEVGSEMFFLRDGYAAVFLTSNAPHWNSREHHQIAKGSYFGEVALLTGQLRTAWIMARNYCVCSVLHQTAIDTIMADDPTCIVSLIKNFQDQLGLQAKTTWLEVRKRIKKDFPDNDEDEEWSELWEFVCSGVDGLAPAGVITWTRYQLLMSRIQVGGLDQKLLWALLDTDKNGFVTFDEFVDR